MSKRLVAFLKDNLLAVFLLVLTLPLFFYNLGGYSLADFDEGWFAEIARNMLVSRQPLLLTFNGVPFTDHPPFGYLLIAISMGLFGINEFAARFPSALLGFGSLVVTYFIGKTLVNRWVGIGAAAIVASSVWFMFRARSGNLDTIFLFFYVLCYFSALKTQKNPRWLYVLAASVAVVLMVKSVIGITIIVPVIILLLQQRIYTHKKELLLSLGIFLLCLLPWVATYYRSYGVSYFSHMLTIGLRPGFRQSIPWGQLGSTNTFLYLHYGIGKWYYLFLVSFMGGVLFVRKNPRLLSIYALIVVLLFSFLTNQKTEIWHLLPLYPFIGLLGAAFFYYAVLFGLKNISLPSKRTFMQLLVVVPLLSLAGLQIYRYRHNIKLQDREESDLAYVAQKARGANIPLYLDGHDFFPSAVFYAQQPMQLLRHRSPPTNSLLGMMQSGPRPFLLLTEKWRLTTDKITAGYELVAARNEWMLIQVN